jgi:Mitochondrial branched-chain alpha-ketoacid dehydrogenase kinase
MIACKGLRASPTSCPQLTTNSRLQHNKCHIPSNFHRRCWKKLKCFQSFHRHQVRQPPNIVSIREMVQFGRIPTQQQLFRGTQFVLNELPIRLAHRVVELENLPHDLSKMPSILKVKNWYKGYLYKVMLTDVW